MGLHLAGHTLESEIVAATLFILRLLLSSLRSS